MTLLSKFQEYKQRILAYLNHESSSKKDLLKFNFPNQHTSALPKFLLLGANQTGKSCLLEQFKLLSPTKNEQSKKPTWYANANLMVIEVPEKYLSLRKWLQFIKKKIGKKAIAGILITLPVTDLLKERPANKLPLRLQDAISQYREIKKTFTYPMPWHLIITQCDLLPGFIDYFSDASSEETAKAWCIDLSLPESPQSSHKTFHDRLTQRFNHLIRNLNQQLLCRLHQERNIYARPFIKNFPLEVEQLKKSTLATLTSMSPNTRHLLQGIYFTSARQAHTIKRELPIEINHHSDFQLELFKEKNLLSRPYFIKQIFSHYLKDKTISPTYSWRPWIVYIAALVFLVSESLILAQDFQRGTEKITHTKNMLVTYQITKPQFHSPYEKLIHAVLLLDSLQHATHQAEKQGVFHFYANHSQKTTEQIYQQSFRQILLPEIKNYLAEYLATPITRNVDSLYSSLKAYLMLADPLHFDAKFITETLLQALPESTKTADKALIEQYVSLSLNTWQPMPLDHDLIKKTRDFLIGTPSFQLGYIILKNSLINEQKEHLALAPSFKSIFAETAKPIPAMFLAKNFQAVYATEINKAAEETIYGNWILGSLMVEHEPSLQTDLIEELQTTYLKNYVKAWEKFLTSFHLTQVENLAQLDVLLTTLTKNDSPLLQFLQIVYENTAFSPIASLSEPLQKLNSFIPRNQTAPSALWYEVFNGLHLLQEHLQAILHASNPHQAAFALVNQRLHHPQQLDIITQLRLLAEKSPMPIKTWLLELSDETWHHLTQEANRYMDVSHVKETKHPLQT